MADHDPHRPDKKMRRMDVWLDEDTLAHYQARAQASGRTLEAQLVYELMVNHGFTVPDPGDLEATQRGQIFRRIFGYKPLNG
jgi:hypothetical protein